MMACTPHYQLGLSKVLLLSADVIITYVYSKLSRSAVAVKNSGNSKYEKKSLNTKSQSKEGDKKKLRISIA